MWIPDLTESEQHKYLALADAIAEAIASGELKVGDRLPPQRQLAWKLGLNPSTTMQAYKEAARRHLIGGEVGRGTFVLGGSKEVSLFQLKQTSTCVDILDLSTNIPVLDSDNRDIEQAMLQLIDSGQSSLLQSYLSPEAITLGKIMVTQWMQLRAVQILPAQVKLCAGAQQGVLAVVRSLCKSGEPILVEEFTAPGIKAISRDFLPLHGVAMDDKGILPQELDRMIRATGAKLLILTPLLQNPTAALMDEMRQQQVAEVIKKYNLIVIEDDVYGGLTDLPPLFSLLPEQTILVSSFSKTVAAGLRVGFMIAEPALLARIDPDYQIVNWAVSPIALMIANQWVNSGVAIKRLQWQREEILQRWRLAKKIIGSYMSGCEMASPHIWLETHHNSDVLADACRQVGVNVASAELFSTKSRDTNAIRISLTAAKSRVELKIALQRIADLLLTL